MQLLNSQPPPNLIVFCELIHNVFVYMMVPLIDAVALLIFIHQRELEWILSKRGLGKINRS